MLEMMHVVIIDLQSLLLLLFKKNILSGTKEQDYLLTKTKSEHIK